MPNTQGKTVACKKMADFLYEAAASDCVTWKKACVRTLTHTYIYIYKFKYIFKPSCLPFFQGSSLELRTAGWTPLARMGPMQGCWQSNESWTQMSHYLPISQKNVISKTWQPKKRCLFLPRHAAARSFMKANTISESLRFKAPVIPKFPAWLLRQCISNGSKTNGLGKASRLL